MLDTAKPFAWSWYPPWYPWSWYPPWYPWSWYPLRFLTNLNTWSLSLGTLLGGPVDHDVSMTMWASCLGYPDGTKYLIFISRYSTTRSCVDHDVSLTMWASCLGYPDGTKYLIFIYRYSTTRSCRSWCIAHYVGLMSRLPWWY